MQPAQPAQGTQASASPYDGLEALEGLGGLSFSSPSSGQAGAQPYDDDEFSPRPTSGAFSSSNPYASLSSHPSNGTDGHAVPDSAAATGGDAHAAELTRPRGNTDSSFLGEYVPEHPSEKALGKIRRVSQGAGAPSSSLSLSGCALEGRSVVADDCSATLAADDQSPEERQHQLEEALRQKYERNYREARAR